MIERIIVAILTKLTSWLMAKGLEKLHGQEEKAATEKEIDQRLKSFKAAYAEAFDGTEVTIEQRKKLNQAIANFIRGDGSGGGL